MAALARCIMRGLARTSWKMDVPQTEARHHFRPGKHCRDLWQDFFSDPSQWWDNRSKKVNARYPDFKHKRTQKGLWVKAKWNPLWVEAQVAAMAPGTVQLSVYAWNTILARCVKTGLYEKTVEIFNQMQGEGVTPNIFTFVPVLKACANISALEVGRRVHKQIIQQECGSDLHVGSTLVDMYAKCGSIEDAWRVFDNMARRDVVAWNAMIFGCVKSNHGQKALQLSKQMQHEGVVADRVTFLGMVNACASVGKLEEGRHVHEQIVHRGLGSGVFIGSSLVDMYAKCGSLEDAWRVFDKMPERNVVSWNAIILGHVNFGQARKALELSQRMQLEGVEPDPVTFVGVIKACATLCSLEDGRSAHQQTIQRDCDRDVFVGSSLIDMYAKCGSIEEAHEVFTKMPKGNVVSWNAMILGYVKCGQAKKALELSQLMQQVGVHPVAVTFVGLLNACTSLGALEAGRCVHEQIMGSSCQCNIFVGNSLVDMYAKCGSVEDAWRVFNKMPTHDVVSWNSMILGLVKCGQGKRALDLSEQMFSEQVEPDAVTFVAFLNACASLAALEEGRHVHRQIISSGCHSDIFVCNSLVDMYARCGSVESATCVFNQITTPDLVSWNAMLGGYAMHGLAKEALGHFDSMCQECVKMDEVTFISLLLACSHGGLVDEGLEYFESLCSVYRIPATVEHWACVIDLLGRAGRLHEAEHLIKAMSLEPDVALLKALLSACRDHGNIEIGERIAGKVLKLDANNDAGYIMLSNIYTAAGKWDSSENIQWLRLGEL